MEDSARLSTDSLFSDTNVEIHPDHEAISGGVLSAVFGSTDRPPPPRRLSNPEVTALQSLVTGNEIYRQQLSEIHQVGERNPQEAFHRSHAVLEAMMKDMEDLTETIKHLSQAVEEARSFESTNHRLQNEITRLGQDLQEAKDAREAQEAIRHDHEAKLMGLQMALDSVNKQLKEIGDAVSSGTSSAEVPSKILELRRSKMQLQLEREAQRDHILSLENRLSEAEKSISDTTDFLIDGVNVCQRLALDLVNHHYSNMLFDADRYSIRSPMSTPSVGDLTASLVQRPLFPGGSVRSTSDAAVTNTHPYQKAPGRVTTGSQASLHSGLVHGLRNLTPLTNQPQFWTSSISNDPKRSRTSNSDRKSNSLDNILSATSTDSTSKIGEDEVAQQAFENGLSHIEEHHIEEITYSTIDQPVTSGSIKNSSALLEATGGGPDDASSNDMTVVMQSIPQEVQANSDVTHSIEPLSTTDIEWNLRQDTVRSNRKTSTPSLSPTASRLSSFFTPNGSTGQAISPKDTGLQNSTPAPLKTPPKNASRQLEQSPRSKSQRSSSRKIPTSDQSRQNTESSQSFASSTINAADASAKVSALLDRAINSLQSLEAINNSSGFRIGRSGEQGDAGSSSNLRPESVIEPYSVMTMDHSSEFDVGGNSSFSRDTSDKRGPQSTRPDSLYPDDDKPTSDDGQDGWPIHSTDPGDRVPHTLPGAVFTKRQQGFTGRSNSQTLQPQKDTDLQKQSLAGLSIPFTSDPSDTTTNRDKRGSRDQDQVSAYVMRSTPLRPLSQVSSAGTTDFMTPRSSEDFKKPTVKSFDQSRLKPSARDPRSDPESIHENRAISLVVVFGRQIQAALRHMFVHLMSCCATAVTILRLALSFHWLGSVTTSWREARLTTPALAILQILLTTSWHTIRELAHTKIRPMVHLIKHTTRQFLQIVAALCFIYTVHILSQVHRDWYVANTTTMRDDIMAWREEYWDLRLVQYLRWYLQLVIERHFYPGEFLVMT